MGIWTVLKIWVNYAFQWSGRSLLHRKGDIVLQLKDIKKDYLSGEETVHALKGIDISFRKSEFVSILGQSGCGKTTLLNIIGGLDRYTSGDLVINGKSTKEFKDRDWDTYRNHSIGFVFQSYNLIPHQNVLSNVELALTLSGVSKAERRRRAKEALEQVGLGDQLKKKPNQMSGGQMQRVAIARALVNNPDILLADEPTGALDSETSVQVMEILKEVAKDKLVIMVTHNPELAEQYSTRIIRVLDGEVVSDSMPYTPEQEEAERVTANAPVKKPGMSYLTALSLSLNNLMTKKGRTILTAFAGSIGIIGIALIISLSQGVNDYIDDMERSTLSEYPLQILSSGMDITSLLSSSNAFTTLTGTQYTSLTVAEEGKIPVKQLVTKMVSGISSNDLTSLKKYLESDECTIRGDATSIEYSYNVSPQIYRQDADGSIRKVNPDSTLSALGISSSSSTNSLMSSMMDTSVFYQLPENSDLYSSQYDVKVGRWPETANECVAVLGKDGSIIDYVLYAMGLRDSAELDKMIQQFAQNQNVDLPQDFRTYSYEDFLGLNFKVVRGADCYEYDETYNIWKDKSEDSDYMKQLVAGGEDLTIVGIVQPKADASAAMLSSGIAYPAALTQHVIEEAKTSAIVQQQMADPTTNVLTGEPFGDSKGLVNSLDLSTIFSVDTDALKHAFSIDPSALNFDLDGAFDLSGGAFDLSSLIDASNFKLDLDALADSLGGMENLPDIDLSEAFAGLDLSISPDALQAFVQKVFKGYKNYIIGNGILNFKKWSFSAYLKSEQFQQLLAESMPDLVDTDAIQGQLTEAVSGVLQTVLESYSDQITDALQTQISAALESSIQSAMGPLMQSFQQNLQTMLEKNLAQLGSQMENAIKIDTKTFQSAIQLNMSTDDLTELMKSTLRSSKSSYEGNLSAFGYADLASPSQIKIYPHDFDSKAVILEKLDAYNASMEAQGLEDKTIRYTDLVGTLMTSVTEIINMISSMLVAFVSISLVVSSIMIGVITYISVLERRKEIGILRAIGASKMNVSEVFNAETFIIGLCSGVMGIVLSEILLIPGNMLIRQVSGSDTLTAILPLDAAAFLIVLATLLTILAGLIPAMGAAKSNPVKALRSE